MNVDKPAVMQKTVASAEITPTRVAARFSHRTPDVPSAMKRTVDTAAVAEYIIHRDN